MDHSYEEIRAAALDVLAGREPSASYAANQIENLNALTAQVFARRENQPEMRGIRLSPSDSESLLEVFWDLFRQGIITLGKDNVNPTYPHFRLSRLGRSILENQDTYFFHDVQSYTRRIKDQVPSIDSVTLLYLQEALQAFRSGCILSSSVMLGVAAEHTFLLLVERVENSSTYATTFTAVSKERLILRKANKFKQVLDQQRKSLPPAINEDLDTHFAGILSIIRTFRNQSGHPTGQILDREQAYVLLNLFVPYCRKMYHLMDHLGR